MDAILIGVGALLAIFVGWKVLLLGVKGISKAISAGVTEGRRVAATSAATSGEGAADLEGELLMATYQLGVSELTRDPKAYGYDPEADVFEPPSDEERAAGKVSVVKLGKAIKKLSPVNPARLALEEVIEQHARENIGAAEADNLAKLHQDNRVLEILKVGTTVRAEQK